VQRQPRKDQRHVRVPGNRPRLAALQVRVEDETTLIEALQQNRVQAGRLSAPTVEGSSRSV
jgi:hypothetical protein